MGRASSHDGPVATDSLALVSKEADQKDPLALEFQVGPMSHWVPSVHSHL